MKDIKLYIDLECVEPNHGVEAILVGVLGVFGTGGASKICPVDAKKLYQAQFFQSLQGFPRPD